MTGQGRKLLSHGRRHALLLALAAGALAWGTSSAARAYCRSTTCSGDCARDADYCKTEGYPLYWSSMCVSFSLQQDGSVNIPFQEIERVTELSFVAWSDLPCPGGNATIAFSRLDNVACHQAEYNEDGPNANVVMFQDYKWEYQDTANTLAKTTVTYDNETGEILDADLEINHAFNEYTTGDTDVVYDLQSVMTHEIGHFIGLDHSPDYDATMNAGYSTGSIEQRTLEPDDVDGVCAVYPPGRDAVCDTRPKGGWTPDCHNEDPKGEEEEGCTCAAAHRGALGGSSGSVGFALLVLAAGLGRLARARRGSRHRSN